MTRSIYAQSQAEMRPSVKLRLIDVKNASEGSRGHEEEKDDFLKANARESVPDQETPTKAKDMPENDAKILRDTDAYVHRKAGDSEPWVEKLKNTPAEETGISRATDTHTPKMTDVGHTCKQSHVSEPTRVEEGLFSQSLFDDLERKFSALSFGALKFAEMVDSFVAPKQPYLSFKDPVPESNLPQHRVALKVCNMCLQGICKPHEIGNY